VKFTHVRRGESLYPAFSAQCVVAIVVGAVPSFSRTARREGSATLEPRSTVACPWPGGGPTRRRHAQRGLTAYLATTPGGLDAVAIIALGSGADAPLVLAVQLLRLFAVVLAGSLLGRC
jgi:hypothetical protein